MPRRPRDLEVLVVLAAALLGVHLLTGTRAFLWAALALLLAGIVSKTLARAIAGLWLGLARFLGWINSRILLSLVFFLVLTPVAILQRTLNPTLRRLFFQREKTMYFTRDHAYTPADLEKPW